MAEENYHEIGKKFLAELKYREAVRAFEKAIRAKNEVGWSYFFLSKAWQGIADEKKLKGEPAGDIYENAKASAENARKIIGVFNIWVLLRLANLHASWGIFTSSAKDFLIEALARDPKNDTWFYSQVAIVYYKLIDNAKAKEFAKKALVLNEQNDEANAVVAGLLARKGIETKDKNILKNAINFCTEILARSKYNSDAIQIKKLAEEALRALG